MKYVTYVLTFTAYVAIHVLRMGYSSVKPYFEKTFQLDSIFLGLFDGLVYISLGLGFFFRFLIEGNSQKTTIYLIFGSLTAIGYAVIPVMGLLMQDEHGLIGEQPFYIQYLIPGLALIMFGFCQFTAWPVLLFLVNQWFNVETEGTVLGIWSANGDVGNVLGFFLGNIVLDYIGIHWEYVMIIGAGLQLFMSVMVFLVLKERPRKDEQLLSEATEETPVGRVAKWK
jgi:sugar phosphate permease